MNLRAKTTLRQARPGIGKLKPLALATHLLTASAMACGVASTAYAQSSQQQRQYTIPAGPLAQALNRFAAQSGVAIVVDANQLRTQRTEGLTGSYALEDGFAALLQGTGYAAEQTPQGYVLRAAQSLPEVTVTATGPRTTGAGALPEVVVTAGAWDGVTEGSGSYAQTGPSTTATRLGLTLRETPQSVTVVTRQQIDDIGLNDMGGVLDYVPGVAGVTYDSESAQYYVRGFEINAITVDGVSNRGNGDFAGEEQQAFDTVQFDRVEVVKGATGLLQGQGNPSASINAIRKRPTRQFQGYATVQAGSFDFYRAEADVGGSLNADGTVRARIAAAAQDNRSYKDNYAKQRQTVYGILEWDLQPSTILSLSGDYQNSETQAPLFWNSLPAFYSDNSPLRRSRGFSTAPSWARHDIEQYSISSALEHRFDNGWTTNLQYRHRGAKSAGIYATPRGANAQTQIITGAGTVNTQPITRANTWEAYATGPFSLFGREHELALGYSYYTDNVETRQYGASFGDISSVGIDDMYNLPEPLWSEQKPSHREYQSSSFYATSRWNIADPLKLIVGARIDSVKQNNVVNAYWGSETIKFKDSGTVIPYAGLVYDINPTTSTYVSYTEIFKPQANYLDANGKGLEPRTGSNIELGVKTSFYQDRLNASLAVYRVKERNIASNSGAVSETTGETIYGTIPGVTTKGIEAEISGEVLPGWQVSGGYTYNDIKNNSGARYLYWVPNKTLKLSSSYKLPGAWNRLTLGGGVRWQGAIYYGSGQTRLDQSSYALVDLFARYQFNERLSGSLNIRNAFDRSYIMPLWGRIEYGEPAAATVTLQYRF